MEVFIMCGCPICGNKSYTINVKEFPEFVRKEFTCEKCGRLLRVENWDRRYL